MGLVPIPTPLPDYLRSQIRVAHDSVAYRHATTSRLAPRLSHVILQGYSSSYIPSPVHRVLMKTGLTQGGSNADIVLADAYIKHLKDGIDWEAGYAAVRKDATEEPFDWSTEGRGGLASWNALHYIPVEDFDSIGFGPLTRSISRTVEYAYNDFAVAQMARSMNKTGDAERFAHSAGNWRNLFRVDQKSFRNGSDTGFVGFFQPRYLNGTWGYQVCSHGA